jgi:hypothetical protein
VLLEDKKDLENDFYVWDEVFRYGELLEGVREEARTKEDLKNWFYRLWRRVFYQDKLIGIFR